MVISETLQSSQALIMHTFGHCDDAVWVFFFFATQPFSVSDACLPVLEEDETVLLMHDTTQTLDGVG